jgi:hypothetical protein
MKDRELLKQALIALNVLDKKQVFIGLRADISANIVQPETEETVDGWPLYSGIPEPHCKTGSQCVAGQCKRCQLDNIIKD